MARPDYVELDRSGPDHAPSVVIEARLSNGARAKASAGSKRAAEMSAARANVMRILLKEAGMNEFRIKRVTGHADREPTSSDPMSVRNNRLEIVLLRDQE